MPNINHQWQAYGGWSFALDDYLDEGVMKYLNSKKFLDLAAVVDPFSYLDRLTMPKLLICSTGDEFFLPDSPQYFYSSLKGENHLRMVPNAEHSLIGHQADVVLSIATFYQLVLDNTPRPQISWDLVKSNTTASITLKLLDNYQPLQVKMWYAHTLSFVQRDFRLVICDDLTHCLEPVFWYDEVLTPVSNGVYQVSMDAPQHGWVGFMIEVLYRFGEQDDLVLTSEVNVVPDRLPFPPCGEHCQN